jgi:hypothetical protein
MAMSNTRDERCDYQAAELTLAIRHAAMQYHSKSVQESAS